MSSDRDRASTDPEQKYRSVVYQQGRVTLAGDANEAQEIAHAALRADVGDIVGPCGTPDDGYAISYPGKAGPADFTISKGTMYLGGERLALARDITWAGQKDGEWLDFPADPAPAAHEQAWLLVREQEVGSVEAPNLLEPALGGPDTTQRTRLVQRVLRDAVQATDCPGAWNEVLANWKTRGFDFDPALMRLTPFARLQVGFAETAPQTDLCQPAPQGGYLGANNQCIRVMATGFDAATGSAKIVWAFDNACHLFKVVVQNDLRTLKLGAPPVDSFHWPRAGQTVEVLRSAVRLADGSTMAQHLGQVGRLATDYNADQRTVQLDTALSDPPFTPASEDPPVFMRLWEQELDATIGVPLTLGDTGLQVTLTAEGNHAVAPGSFWLFAVRPATPKAVYPQRYLAAPQAPDGPRQWACPLGVLHWAREAASVTPCRPEFDNLVELTKRRTNACCEFTVGTSGHFPNLALAMAAIAEQKLASATLCLLPDPPVHKLGSLVTVRRQPQLRLEISGAGPMTVLEIEGGGLDIQGILALALNKLHVRLMDPKSQFLVQHCESLEVTRTRIDRLSAVQTVPVLESASNRAVRIEDSTFDAGYALWTEFVATLATASPLTAPLFALELLTHPLEDTAKRLAPLAALKREELDAALKITMVTASRLGFDSSPYANAMGAWLRVVSTVEGATGEKLLAVARQLLAVLTQFQEIQSAQPGTGVVLDHVGDNWLESSQFRCAVSFSGAPGKRIDDFSAISKVFKERQLTITDNGQVVHLARCTFDLLTYGDSFVKFLGLPHDPGAAFHAPTSLVVEGCVFHVSPCFLFGDGVFLTNNRFTYRRNLAAWVVSRQFCPVSNTSGEGPIAYLAQNNLGPFQPINLVGLMAG